MKTVAGLIRDVRRRIRVNAALEHLSTAAVFVCGGFIVLLLVDMLFAPPSALLGTFYVFSAAIAGYSAYRYAAATSQARLSDANIVLRIQKEAGIGADELISAWQLRGQRPEGISIELIGKLLENAETRARAISAAKVVPVPARGLSRKASLPLCLLGASLIMVALVPPAAVSARRIVRSLVREPWSDSISIQPQNQRFPWGTRVEITVRNRRTLPGTARLLVSADNGPWKEKAMERRSTGEFAGIIEKLTDPVRYYVAWDGIESPRFTITPVMFPQLGEFSVEYRYPAYTGLARQTVRGSGSITGIAGTMVAISARSDKLLKDLQVETSWKGTPYARSDGSAILVQFRLAETGNYRIRATDEWGMSDPQPPEYAVSVTPDLPPRVELLSPREDLIVSDDAIVPLVLDVSDDFGVRRIDLVYRVNEQKQGRIPLPFSGGRVQRAFEYSWRVRDLDPKPGDRIRYYIEVRDNNPSAGAGPGATEPLTIEINDFKKEHDRIEADLKQMKEKLMDILADQTISRGDLAEITAQFSTSTWQSAARGQKKAMEKTRPLTDAMNNLLSRMASDPYTDFSTYNEYKGLASHLEHMSGKAMPEALAQLEGKKLPEAARSQDEIIAQLEKMSLLSEDIWQYQRMRDVTQAGAQLKNEALDLLGGLKAGRSAPELKKALDRIQDLLGKISEQLTKFPQELPEDFVNSPAIKEINMDSYRQASQALRSALERGDNAEARRLAEKMAADLESLLSTIETAGESAGFGSSASSSMRDRLQKQSVELQKIVADQENISRAIESMESVRRTRMFHEQEKLLGQLAQLQKKIIADARKAFPVLLQQVPTTGANLNRSFVLMDKVLEEFSNRRVYHSQKYLEDIIRSWDDARRIAAAAAENAQAAAAEAGAVADGEKEILSALRKVTPAAFSEGEGRSLREMGQGEAKLSERTRKLRQSLEEFLRRSAAIEPGAFDNLSGAAGEMQSASGSLDALNSGEGMQHSAKALDYLREAQKAMENAVRKMGEQGSKSGQGAGSSLQIRSGSGNSQGFRSAPVRLPRADEYRPPREFRQEILDALKEKYPRQYEQMIQEYYRKLTE